MRNELIVVGTSGLAKEVAHIARQIDPHAERWKNITYVTERSEDLGGELVYGRIGYCDEDIMAADFAADVVIGIGMPTAKRRVAERLRSENRLLRFPNLIHPSVRLHSQSVDLGIGNVVAGGVVPTVDIKIGDFNLFNLNVTIGHDVVVGSCCVVNPGVSISGFCKIGDSCLVGTGAVLIEHIEVCDAATIGAGAVVARSITEPGVYVGIPAKRRTG